MILEQISKLDKVLILGYAREGQSTHKFLSKKFPSLKIDVADGKDNPQYLDHLQDYQIIIKTPGISPHKPEIVVAKKAGVIFASHIQIFFETCPSRNIIGITGTKGKSTTTSLIYHLLSENNIKCSLVGNIGRPALDYLPEITPDTWVVCELSSYQLMDLTISPHIAVLQSIYPDHLDYHQDFEEYKNAKLNITKFQTSRDYLITNLKVHTDAQIIPNNVSPVSSKLLGPHNQLNIGPSVIIGRLLKIPENKILSTIASFTPLQTRLELVGQKNGIKFYSDTLATIPEATIAAIEALDPTTLIAGGHERHQDYQALAKIIRDSNIKTLILFPATGPRIAKEVGPTLRMFHANSMAEAVNLAFQHTPANTNCLLSPAAPSFTLFKDYKDEALQYKTAIDDAKAHE